MHSLAILLIAIVVVALVFDYINGFHDTANAIATVVSTRVLAPRSAILMAAGLNFVGAIFSTSVAKTIAKGLVSPHDATQTVVLAAILGAIVWNLVTWRFGIPSSSSHALIGGLCGAAIAHGGARTLLWSGRKDKVLVPLVSSPIAGFILGLVLMFLTYLALARRHPGRIGPIYRRLQLISAASMAFAHGQNDAQKSMGIITLALLSAHVIHSANIPLWVVILCATAMAIGTSVGGWRIMHTMGHRIIRLAPVQGFAAEASAAAILFTASHFGMPVSTTHVISGSIMGVGVSKRLSAVRWGVAQSMVIAWVLTLPAAALVAASSYWVLHLFGLR